MRLLACVVALAMLAGCLSDDSATNDDGQDNMDDHETPVPEPLHFEGSLTSVTAPVVGVTTGCDTGGCTTHTFEVPNKLRATLTLVSNQGTVTGASSLVWYPTDYDLTLRDDAGNELGNSINPGNEADEIVAVLEPGTYHADVMAWHDMDGSYDLDIVFEAL